MGQEGNEIIRTPGLSESSARFLTTSLFALVIAFPEPLKQYKSHPTAWDLHKELCKEVLDPLERIFGLT